MVFGKQQSSCILSKPLQKQYYKWAPTPYFWSIHPHPGLSFVWQIENGHEVQKALPQALAIQLVCSKTCSYTLQKVIARWLCVGRFCQCSRACQLHHAQSGILSFRVLSAFRTWLQNLAAALYAAVNSTTVVNSRALSHWKHTGVLFCIVKCRKVPPPSSANF